MWRRVAHALAAPEGHEQRLWEKRFYTALHGFGFLPAGRILAGAGTGRDVTLFNCFVQGTIGDSMENIFQRIKEGALTQQQGGGIGMDFSTIRPNGADVKGVAAKASGPLSFMDVWDAMCKTIMSAGARRGAMMGTLRCDHPDIEAFIEAKKDPARFRNFNLSVLVTNDFMSAVKEGKGWALAFGDKVYKIIDARALWDKIMRSAYETAEPGVIFIDRINETNNLAYCETIAATNPCAEQPLPPDGACLLGSINLTAFIREPFEPSVYWDEHKVIETTRLAVRMMDNVIDVSNYPIKAQREEAMAKRRIGLGVTGLADALAMCGLHYGSPEACRTAALWMKTINNAAYDTSITLAAEKGKFPLWSEKMGLSYYPERGAKPTRNGTLTSIAPTGTISLLAGNISGGIEPIFEWNFTRNVTMPDGSRQPVEVEDYAVHIFRRKFPGQELPPQFLARAHELSPKQHLAMQAALQPHVDASISKTVNCPKDMPFEEFEQLYMDAYEAGLKCCAAFREGAIANAILQTTPPAPKLEAPPESEGVADLTAPFPERLKSPYTWQNPQDIPNMRAPFRWQKNEPVISAELAPGLKAEAPQEIMDLIHQASGAVAIAQRQRRMPGYTHKLKWGGHAVYVTINDNPDGSPHEIFINSKNSEHYAWSVALTRLITAIWRRGGDTSFVTEELKAIADPRGGLWMEGRYIPSIQAAIGYVIEEHIGAAPVEMEERVNAKMRGLSDALASHQIPAHFCPKCGSANVWFPKPNCLTCRDCAFSNCD
jgi:ribonucleoside-diphosphate reductase alpha chain